MLLKLYVSLYLCLIYMTHDFDKGNGVWFFSILLSNSIYHSLDSLDMCVSDGK
jgi:hypothetical protein